MLVITNGKIFNGVNFLEEMAIVIQDNKIHSIISNSEITDDMKIIDAQNGYVTPGFIDLQLNGCGGVLFNESITRETLEKMNETNLKYGCTSFTPTLITTSNDNIEKALKLINEMEDKEKIGVLGLHIEGPYISKEKKGIHNIDEIRIIDEKTLKSICDSQGKTVKIITIAPENVIGEHIAKLADAGIKVALGHTNATYSQIEDKKKYGISLATHLYNGMSGFIPREPGAIGAIFNLDIYSGIIVDGFHSDYASVQIAKKIMGERLYLVTDAVAPAGTDMKFFFFEGKKVFHENGKCFSEDGTLGGSALTMIEGVRNLVKYVNLTLEEAIRMATLYPAKACGIDMTYGKLKAGYFADIVIMNENLEILNVISKGKVYKK